LEHGQLNLVKSEETNCPVCGAGAVKIIFAADGYSMGRCRGCGLVRQCPRLTEEWLRERHYDDDSQRYEDEARPRKPPAVFEESVRLLERIRGPEKEPGLWVDVGASSGKYLVAARKNGWAVAGAEINKAKVDFCREHHGLDVFYGTLAEAGYPDGFADVVSYRHVLEHIHDLHGEIAEARRILKPGGMLFVEVPHYGGVKSYTDWAQAFLRLIPKERLFRYVPAHLYYFNRKQIIALFDHSGFETVYSRTYGRFRARRSALRRMYDSIRDQLCLGNKIRVIARQV